MIKFNMKNCLWRAAQGGVRCGVVKPRKKRWFLKVALWGGSGGLWALLGRSWGGLRRSWDDLGATLRAVHFPIYFLIDFGREKGAQREAKGRPKSSKIGPKTSPNLRRFSKGKKSLFKTVLEASWVDLGTLGPPHFCTPACGGAHSTFLMPRGVQERSGSEK